MKWQLKDMVIVDETGANVSGLVPSRMSSKTVSIVTAAPDMLAALKYLRLECLADVLNPCWDNRPSDRPGLHWGSEEGAPVPACSSCIAKAAIAKAEGR